MKVVAMRGGVSLEGILSRVSLRTASSLDLGEVLGEVTGSLVGELDAALARIWLIAPGEPETLRLAASAGLSTRLDGTRSRVAITALKIGEIARARAPLWTNDLAADPRFEDQAWIERHGLVAFAGYPLLYRDDLLGVLAIFSRAPLGAAHVEALEVFAAQAAVAIQNANLFAKVDALMRRLEAENAYLKTTLDEERPRVILGKSAALAQVLAELERVSGTDSTVLLLGETGTGKELFARAAHAMSRRRAGPLIKVNCAALTPSLVESELFGHERGAFTGATQRRLGRFELADRGTLFLDEIAELSVEAQAKLLRAVQERELERVGGSAPVRVDVRLVAATHRDLAAEVRAGRFRSDLFFRLNVFPLHIPPLRERPDDIPELAASFLLELGARLRTGAKSIDHDALAYLMSYDWPGNVRELHNVLERAAILARGSVLGVADLPQLESAVAVTPPNPRGPDETTASLKDRVTAYERSLVLAALERASGNQSEAARLLGTSRATLQYKMRALRVGAGST